MTEPTSRHLETPTETVERQRCQEWTEKLFRTSPMVRFMHKHLQLLDCDPASSCPSAQPRILIAPCPPTVAGGFSPASNAADSSILICSNRIMGRSHLQDTLAHEMVHWYDHCRFAVNWADLRHHACSEIRAASLSGDCKFTREFQRRNYGLKSQHQKCVRRRAVLSLMSNPECKDQGMAEKVVDEVWKGCFGDTRPFDEIY